MLSEKKENARLKEKFDAGKSKLYTSRDDEQYKLGGSTDTLNDAIDSILSPDVEEVRDLRSDLAAPTGTLITETQAVLPVDPRKDTAINKQIASASVPNRTNTGIFQQYFPRGIFS